MRYMRPAFLGTVLFAVSMGVGVIGCGSSADQSSGSADMPTPEGSNNSSQDAETAADKEIEAALAVLSPEDRALAEKQKNCPVGGEPLGSMGTPIKMTVEGRELFICCAGCDSAVRNNPEKYFKKLDMAAE